MTNLPAFIGRYQVLDRIGEGGMGALFLSRDPAIERLVAIKLLRHGFDTDEARERFAREARAAGRLHHPHVVTIFDVGVHEGSPFIAMEFLAGETLAQLIRQRARLTLSRKLILIEELCDGLAYAHRAGMVHRDIKPANVMVDSAGILKILDFGIVRTDESAMTGVGEIVGTINYMAPEQVSGDPVDHRSDIFAVGVVAYELLAYRQAFPGTIKDGVLDRIRQASVTPLSVHCPTLDPEVIRIVQTAMAADPAHRYQDLARMRNDVAVMRQRLERDEARADAFTDAETTVLPLPLTGSGSTPTSGSGTGSGLSGAQHALTTGNYQQALLIASRAAAIAPDDFEATTIVERAKLALLREGKARSDASQDAVTRPPTSSESAPTTSSAAARDASAVAGTSAPSRPVAEVASHPAANPIAALPDPATTHVRRRGIVVMAAVAVCVLAGVIAVFVARPPQPQPETISETRGPAAPATAPAPPTQPGPTTSPSTDEGGADGETESQIGEPSSTPPTADSAADEQAPATVVQPPAAAQPTARPGRPTPPRGVDALKESARRAVESSRLEEALGPIETGLAASPDDRELEALLAGLLVDARARAATARDDAESADAKAQASALYSSGVEHMSRAERLETSGEHIPAIRELWAAIDAFSRARRLVRPPAPALSAGSREGMAQENPAPGTSTEPSGARTATPDEAAASRGTGAASAAPTAAPSPNDSTAGSRVAPPVPPSATSARAPEARTTPAEARASAEAAVRQLLKAYEAAWESLNVAAIRQVYALTDSDAARIEATLSAARRYVMEITVQQLTIEPDGRRAVATCQVRREFHPRVGSVARQTVTNTFRLEQRGAGWLIVSVQ